MVDFTPFGINETENTSGNKRPMFGHTNDDCGLHSNATCIWEECTVHHYAFWILTSTQEHHVTPGSIACIDP